VERVVVIGGGIGGLEVALRAERKGFNVELVDPGDSMLFYPSAHRILEGESTERFSIGYKEKFSDRDTVHRKSRADKIDFDDQNVSVDGQDIDYDYLVLAIGSETEFYDTPGQEKAKTMRFKEEAQEIHEKISGNGNTSVAIVGGGATGVEATASLLEVRKEKSFDISLIHGSERLLPGNGKELADEIEVSLESKGVNLIMGKKAVEINDSDVKLDDGGEIPADIVLWAGGVKPNSFIHDLSLEKDRGGLRVDENMLTDRENVFAVGDVASYEGKENRALHAIFEAKTVSENIFRLDRGKELVGRDIKWDPQLIYLGRNNSALEFRGKYFCGLIPSIIRDFGVEKRYLWSRKYWL
jgi:NADH dehydrogenase